MRRTAPARRSRIHRGSGDAAGRLGTGFVPGSTRAGRNAKRNVPDGSRSRLTGGRSSGRGPRGRPPPPRGRRIRRPRAAPNPGGAGAGAGADVTRKTAATSGLRPRRAAEKQSEPARHRGTRRQNRILLLATRSPPSSSPPRCVRCLARRDIAARPTVHAPFSVRSPLHGAAIALVWGFSLQAHTPYIGG